MRAIDNHFAQATTSCQPPQRLSARQHSCLPGTVSGTSLLRLANDRGHQVCHHLQAQHNNAVHASLAFHWSSSVRWDVHSPSRSWKTLLRVIQSTAAKIPSRHHSSCRHQGGQNYHGRNAYENLLVGVPSPSLSTLTSPKPFFHFLVTRTILPQTRYGRHTRAQLLTGNSTAACQRPCAIDFMRPLRQHKPPHISIPPYRHFLLMYSLVYDEVHPLRLHLVLSSCDVAVLAHPTLDFHYEVRNLLILHNFWRPSRFSHPMWSSTFITHLIRSAVGAFEATSRLPLFQRPATKNLARREEIAQGPDQKNTKANQ